MNGILLYLLEVNIIVTVVYLAYRVVLSRDTHFQWRRAFMLTGITVAVVFPLIDFGTTAESVGNRIAYVGPALQVVHGAVNNAVTMSQLMCSRCSLRYMRRSLPCCCSILS